MHDLSYMHIYGKRMEVPGALIIDGTYLTVITYKIVNLFDEILTNNQPNYQHFCQYVCVIVS